MWHEENLQPRTDSRIRFNLGILTVGIFLSISYMNVHYFLGAILDDS